MNKFVKIRRELHRIPELGFNEFKTQAYLLELIQNLPQDNVSIEIWETGLFVFVKGKKPSRTIGYRTDIDGLSITEETNLEYASEHQGCMHACGHDFHMSIALGVLENVVLNRVEDDMLFIFQPAEEAPGGARPMIESDAFQKHKPDILIALHVSPRHQVGEVAVKPGILFANTSEVHVTLTGVGGHAAFPHETKDMVVASANLITMIQSIVSRNVNPLDAVVVTFGEMLAGSANNIIAESATLRGTIRTLSQESLVLAKTRIQEIAQGLAISFGCEIDVEFKNEYLHVDNKADLTQEFIRFIENESACTYVPCDVAMTGEDFGYMLNEVPGFMFWLGVNSPNGLHTSRFNPDENAIEIAIHCISQYINFLEKNR